MRQGYHRLLQIFSKHRKQAGQLCKYINWDFIILIALVYFALVEIVGHYNWLTSSGGGLPQSADSQWYIDYAGAITANLKDGLDINDIFYFGYNILLAGLLAIFKDTATVVLVQAVTASFSVILVYQIAKILFNRTTAIIASGLYIKAYDITLWSMYILSDSFFVDLLLLCVYFLLRALEDENRTYRVLFVVTALYMIVFRPVGIIVLAAMLVYSLLRLRRKVLADFIKRYRAVLGALAVAMLATGILLYTNHYLDLFISSLQFNAKKVLYNIYAKGWIYDKPTEYDHFFRPDYRINICNSLVLSFIINNWDNVSIVYGKRAFAFMGPWVWKTDFGSVAGLIKQAENLVPVALFLIGTIVAVINGVFRKASLAWLLIMAVFTFCLLLFVDWMYRYRLPAIPFFAMIAAYGAERILSGALLIVKKIYGDAAKWIMGRYWR